MDDDEEETLGDIVEQTRMRAERTRWSGRRRGTGFPPKWCGSKLRRRLRRAGKPRRPRPVTLPEVP